MLPSGVSGTQILLRSENVTNQWLYAGVVSKPIVVCRCFKWNQKAFIYQWLFLVSSRPSLPPSLPPSLSLSLPAVDLKNPPGAVYYGEPRGEKAGCTLTLSDKHFMGLVSGELKAQQVIKYSGTSKQGTLWG